MSVIGLVNQAVAWYAASAVLAFLFAMRKPLSGAIAGIGGAVASAMLVVAGGAALLMPERIHGGMLQFLPSDDEVRRERPVLLAIVSLVCVQH